MSSVKAALCWSLVAGLMVLAACSNGRPPPREGDDPNGATTFAKSFGGAYDDVPIAAVETADGGYAFVGTRGDGVGDDGAHPTWLVRLDTNGNVLWQNTIADAAVGGILGRRPFNLVAAAVPGGGFCLAGTVAGQQGDTGNLYVGFLDGQDNLAWEQQLDSGEWNGYELIASGDRGPFAHDQALAVQPGPDGSCYVGAASFANLRDSFGVGIRNSSGSLVIDGDNFIDARSLVIARVSGSGVDWLRRDDEGAFDRQRAIYRLTSWSSDSAEPGGPPVASVDLRMISMSDGGLAVASILEDDSSVAGSPSGMLRVDYYDSSGTPQRLLTNQDIGDIEHLQIAESNGDLVIAEDRGSSARLRRIMRDGNERWNRTLPSLNQPVALHSFVDPSGQRLASFGGNGSNATIMIFDAVSGDQLNTRDLTNTNRFAAVTPLPVTGRFLAAADSENAANFDVLQELDLLVSSVLVNETLTDIPLSRAEAGAGVAYALTRTSLEVQDSNGSSRVIPVRATESAPIGLVELAGDRFGVAIRRGGLETDDTYVIVDRNGIEAALTLGFDGSPGKIDAIAPGNQGGAALLVRHTRPGEPRMREYAIVERNDTGQIAGISNTFAAASPWQLARLHGTTDGGYAAMAVDGDVFATRITEVDADGIVTSYNEYFGNWFDFEPLRDGGFALAGSLYNEDELFGLMRVDAAGDVRWSRKYVVPGAGRTLFLLPGIAPASVRETADGALTVATTTRGLMNSGFIGEGDQRIALPYGASNITLVRLDANGNPQWLRVHGALLNESLTGMLGTGDGGFLVTAVSDSLGQPSVNNDRLTNEAWLLRLGPDGRVVDGCNAFLANLPGEIVTVIDQPTTDVVFRPPIVFSSPAGAGIGGSTFGLSVASPPIVEARQCAGIAATGNTPAPDTTLRTLTVNQSGSINGLVASLPGGIFCGGTGPQACSRAFADGSSVFLTVDDSSAAEFRGWGDGCASVSSGPARCEVLMNADRTIDAFFEPWDGTTATLNVDVIGAGRVVAFEPTGIDCYDDATASDCTETYRLGQRVLLSMSAQPGESFQGWGGACASWATAQTIRVTVDGDQTCTAQFTGVGFTPRYRLSTAISLDGAVPVNTTPGSILSAPGGAECGAPGDDCMGDYDVGATVQLAARPATDYQFARWTSSVAGSDCDGATTPIVDVMLNSDVDCTADFTFAGGNVAILNVGVRLDGVEPPAAGPFGGNVTSLPAGINCGSADSDCVEGYVRFTSVVLTATADTGYRFSRWFGDCSSSISSVTVPMNGDRSCTAEFVTNVQPGTATLDIVVNGGGTVTSNPAGIDCGNDCTEAYPLLTVVDLVAAGTPTEPFLSWGGDCSGGANTQVIMGLNRQCIANFAPVAGTFRLTINVVGNGTVSTLDSGIACPGDCIEDYPANARTIVDAIPGAGERLVGWTGDCLDLADTTQFSLTMFRDWNCTATFAP